MRPRAASRPGAGTDPRAVAPVDAQSARGVDPFNDPTSPLYKKSVFFDFDSFVVKPEFQPVVEAHGKYLASTKNRRIVIEGHTDERGGREYNLALGQKRAEAVKQRLMLLGATDSQIETVSFGKEKPRAIGLERGSLGAEPAGGHRIQVARAPRVRDPSGRTCTRTD